MGAVVRDRRDDRWPPVLETARAELRVAERGRLACLRRSTGRTSEHGHDGRSRRGRSGDSFDRVSRGTVVTESRHPEPELEIESVDLDDDVAVAYFTVSSESPGLMFFERRREGWTPTVQMTLDPECIDSAPDRTVHVGNDNVVVPGRDVWCIFERRTRWDRFTIPRRFAETARVSGNRVFLGSLSKIDQLVRRGGAWRRTTLVSAAGMVMGHDASDHRCQRPLVDRREQPWRAVRLRPR